MTDYVAAFNRELLESDESKKTLRESMQNWLEVFKFPSVERSTYDRCECTAKHQIYPSLGDRIVSDATAADIKDLINQKMQEGYAYTTVKKVYVILGEYFRYLTQQEIIAKKQHLQDLTKTTVRATRPDGQNLHHKKQNWKCVFMERIFISAYLIYSACICTSDNLSTRKIDFRPSLLW